MIKLYYWDSLHRYAKSLVGHSLLILSLLQVPLSYVGIQSALAIQNDVSGRLTLLGSLLYLVAFVVCTVKVPLLISTYATIDNYRDKCLERKECINVPGEFMDLEETPEKALRELMGFNVSAFFPIAQAIDRNDLARSIYVYSTMQYRKENISSPVVRVVIAIVMILGAMLMSAIPISNILVLFGGSK